MIVFRQAFAGGPPMFSTRLIFVAAGAPLLAGCAASAAGLARTSVEMTVPSEKSAQVFASCVAEHLLGNNPVQTDGTRYWVLRLNSFNVPAVRWDFVPAEGGGSVAELRATISINSGVDKVKACAA